MKIKMLLNKTRKKFILLLSLTFPLMALSGCNTVEGVGTDIKQGGKALEHTVENNKECSRPCLRPCPYCGRRH